MPKSHRFCIHHCCIEKFPQWWNLAQLYITWIILKKCLDHVRHSLSFANISIFYHKIQIKAAFQCLRPNFFYFFETWKTFLINMIAIFIKKEKMFTPGCLEINIFRSKVYDVIISVHCVTYKVWFCKLAHIVL